MMNEISHRDWKGLGVVAVLLLVLLGLGIYWVNTPPPSSQTKILEIPRGSPASQTVRALKEGGHLRSAHWFKFLMHVTRASRRLQAGTYEIESRQSAAEILRALVSGKALMAALIVPEGFASWQIAERLEKAGICSADSFRKVVAERKAEGFLFPETYFFRPGTPAEKVCALMEDRFDVVWNEVLKEALSAGEVTEADASFENRAAKKIRLADGTRWTCAQAVTMASLIEREARKDEERSWVSAVYHNRLKKRMRLEADPTVQFSLGFWKDRLLYRDLDVDNPYNTYRNYGLPPGPICSPGRESLKAALSPATKDSLYFVADDRGGHVFTSTYKQHLKEVRQRRQRKKVSG